MTDQDSSFRNAQLARSSTDSADVAHIEDALHVTLDAQGRAKRVVGDFHRFRASRRAGDDDDDDDDRDDPRRPRRQDDDNDEDDDNGSGDEAVAVRSKMRRGTPATAANGDSDSDLDDPPQPRPQQRVVRAAASLASASSSSAAAASAAAPIPYRVVRTDALSQRIDRFFTQQPAALPSATARAITIASSSSSSSSSGESKPQPLQLEDDDDDDDDEEEEVKNDADDHATDSHKEQRRKSLEELVASVAARSEPQAEGCCDDEGVATNDSAAVDVDASCDVPSAMYVRRKRPRPAESLPAAGLGRSARDVRPEPPRPAALFDSVRELLADVERATHPGLQAALRKHAFVGVVDDELSLIQFGTKLLLINHLGLARELFYQQVCC